MHKPKPIDDTADRLGRTLRRGRIAAHMSLDTACHLLRVTPDELIQYERGTEKFPQDIMEHLFMMGYRMMRFRILGRQRRIYRRIKDIVTEEAYPLTGSGELFSCQNPPQNGGIKIDQNGTDVDGPECVVYLDIHKHSGPPADNYLINFLNLGRQSRPSPPYTRCRLRSRSAS